MAIIQGFLNGMLTLMLAKFVLNDVPHVLGLAEKEPHVYTMYRMHCPRMEPHVCGHEYRVSMYEDPSHKWEFCPLCGYGAPFMEFVKG